MLSQQDAVGKIIAGDADFHRTPDVFYQAVAAQSAPVFRLDNDGPWWCCSYTAAAEVLGRPESFRMGSGEERRSSTEVRLGEHWLELLDGGPHRAVRRVLQAAVSSAELRSPIDRAMANLSLQPYCDVVRDLIRPFWLRFQTAWLGLDEQLLASLNAKIPELLAVVMDIEPHADDEQAALDATATLARVIDNGHEGTGRGLLGALLALDLPPTQIAAHLVNLIVDMSVIPTSLGVCGARILDDPIARRSAASPDELPSVLSECLRLDPPQMLMVRTAVRNCELHGNPIRRDDQVVVIVGVANRDSSYFVDPTAFHAQRPETSLTFGLGPHSCLGRRLFVQVAVAFMGELLSSGMDVVRAGDSVHSTQVGIRSIESLPVHRVEVQRGVRQACSR